MYPLMATSIVALAVIFERVYVILFRTKAINNDLLAQVLALVKQSRNDDARSLLEEQPNFSGPVLLAILDETDEAHQENVAGYAGDELLFALQQRMSILSTIATLAPLMGLLGTVLGMIKVFAQVAQMGEVSNTTMLAGGIWEALLTTAVGMAIAIPVLIIYHYLQRYIGKLAHGLRHNASALIAVLRRYPMT